MATIKIIGIDELERKLKDNCRLDDVKTVVRQNGAELHSKMQREAVFVKGYSVGDTKSSISLELRDSGFTAAVSPGTEYSPYLEYGTRFMDAQPFVRPAFNAQKVIFKNDLNKLMR